MENYATIAKPLTKHLLGENGRISQHKSKNTEINLDEEGIQPDYTRKFVLTTEASNMAIGAVISQDITNEKELYAIVWALKNLRNYLYRVTNLEIHTDHQPLTFAV